MTPRVIVFRSPFEEDAYESLMNLVVWITTQGFLYGHKILGAYLIIAGIIALVDLFSWIFSDQPKFNGLFKHLKFGLRWPVWLYEFLAPVFKVVLLGESHR